MVHLGTDHSEELQIKGNIILTVKKFKYVVIIFIIMVVQPFVGPWPLILDHIHGRTPWMEDQPIARPLPTHRINAHNTDIHA
jgi:hypothetical protein